MIRTKSQGEITLEDGYTMTISCDHCFAIITQCYVNLREGYGGLYQPQLCEQCWKNMTNRISELVMKEDKLQKVIWEMNAGYTTESKTEKIREILGAECNAS